MIEKIIIVGGGTAGWLTAGILAARFNGRADRKLEIILVESPEVNTIGVGEGTWPTMRTTLKKIGLAETDFLLQCDASFKQGSKFVAWRSGGSSDFYYHPFTAPPLRVTKKFLSIWRRHFPELSFADLNTVQGQLCERGLAPKLITMAEYSGAANYAYHLDAGKFGELLKRHCVQKLSVKHISDHILEVKPAPNGDVASVVTRNNGEVRGGLYIDCSGSAGLLLAQHLQVPFVDCEKYSCNDRAIALQVPYEHDNDPIASATLATAQEAGWIWDIGLASRRGIGYVYSSSYTSDEAAEQTVRSYAEKLTGKDKTAQLASRKLSFKAGYRAQFWRQNVVAVGMAAGFIEPLEASAIALVELSANTIRDEMPVSREAMDTVAKRFNKLFLYRWQRIIEFLKLHYVLSQRNDTAYWQDVRQVETIPDGLREALELWRHRPPYYNDFPHSEEIFPEASYQYVLYGMGYPSEVLLAEDLAEEAAELSAINEVQTRAKTYMANLPSNRELINAIARHGMKKI